MVFKKFGRNQLKYHFFSTARNQIETHILFYNPLKSVFDLGQPYGFHINKKKKTFNE